MYVTHKRKAGFTLIEITVVLLVISLILGAAISLLGVGLFNLTYKDTQSRMRIIQQALLDYRIAYDKLPCPANYGTYATTDANFGIAADGTTCTGSPSADFGDANSTFGMLPVRTLGLPDDMAFDGWGRRLRYAVGTAYTLDNAFTTKVITATTGGLTVKNADNTDLTTNAVYVVVSYGENGHGARGGATGTLINANSSNGEELLNCKCNTSGAYDSGVNGITFVQNEVKPNPDDITDKFDDIVVFATRAQMPDADE